MLNKLPSGFRLLSRFTEKFGFWSGFRIFVKIYPLYRSNKFKTIKFSLYGKSLAIRLGTTDLPLFRSIFLDDEFDLSFLKLNTKINPKLIFDLGANVGYTSIFFAHTYPHSRIFAVEPESSNFELLKENVKNYKNIVPFQAAIWNKKTKLNITDLNAEKYAFRVSETENEAIFPTVDTITIDELLKVAGSNEIDILKIDIEGAEIELFNCNFENWLEKSNLIVIELHDRLRKGCSEVFNKAVGTYHFQLTKRGEHTILVKKQLVSDAVVK